MLAESLFSSKLSTSDFMLTHYRSLSLTVMVLFLTLILLKLKHFVFVYFLGGQAANALVEYHQCSGNISI